VFGDGSVLAAATANPSGWDTVLYRLRPNGAADTNFNTTGNCAVMDLVADPRLSRLLGIHKQIDPTVDGRPREVLREVPIKRHDLSGAVHFVRDIPRFRLLDHGPDDRSAPRLETSGHARSHRHPRPIPEHARTENR
jgi:hypothetical protein